MKKKQKATPKKTWHDKFVELAREAGADESESVFADKLRKIAKPPEEPKKKGRR